jgi:hypothetical protein
MGAFDTGYVNNTRGHRELSYAEILHQTHKGAFSELDVILGLPLLTQTFSTLSRMICRDACL